MAKNLTDDETNNVHIEQIDPHTELSDLEKTAIMQFRIDKAEEELSKTQQFRLMNKKKKANNVDLPTLKDEKKDDLELPVLKNTLLDTIKIKLSDLRENIDKKYEEASKEEVQVKEETQQTENIQTKEEAKPEVKPVRKSLYDTVIIKLDDIINKKSALKSYASKKVTNIEKTPTPQKKFHLFKPRDITKMKKFKINVESEEFGRQLYNLNKIALNNLGLSRPSTVRKYSTVNKLSKIEKVHISKHNYLRYQQRLNKFAINKLYYKLAPKESKKYKLYKTSVILSSIVFFITSAIIINWFIQGISVNELSNALVEDTPIVEVADAGEILVEAPEEPTEEAPAPEKNKEYSDKNTLYWKYLNTPLSSVDFNDLLKQNSDTVAWIIVKNTNVNYPVVQTTNNDYYLHHSFNRKTNGAGWVFADFRDNFNDFNQNMVIYAHGRKDKVMFGSLTNTLKPNWYKNTDNQIIQLSTLKYNTMWQIFSIYKVEAESYYITTDFGSKESYATFIQKMKDRSIYDFGIDVTTDDKILTLSTCYNDNGIRLVVQAKLVKIQERK